MIREDPGVEAPATTAADYVPITLTTAAAQKLRRVMEEKGLADAGLRVFVNGGGCSGLQYGMAFVTEGETDDIIYDSEGMRVHVDPVSIPYVQGAHIDFEDSLLGGGFKIDNPNAMSSCGCGSSFKPAQDGASNGGCGSGCGCS